MDEGWAAQQTGTRNMELVTTTELSVESEKICLSERSEESPQLPLYRGILRHFVPQDDMAEPSPRTE